MRKKLTTQEFIDKSNLVHKNKYIYNKSYYNNSKEKLIITCHIHGDFIQLPSNHLKGHGCNGCGLISTIDSKPINNNTFLHKNLKECKKCKNYKTKKDFSKDKNSIDGFQTICKLCTKQYKKKYYLKNKDFVKTRIKKYYKNNIEGIKESKKQYYKENKELIKEKNSTWRSENKNKIKLNRNKTINKFKANEFTKRKRVANPLFALTSNIRNSINKAFRERNFEKPKKTAEILGCNFQEFKLYIESQFEPWMTWSNRGLYNGKLKYGWDIDHIIPISTAKCKEDIVKLNHFTNLQPLCSKFNRDIKSNKFNI